MAKTTAKSGKKGRKFGRNRESAANKRYIAENRREKNKIIKLKRHVKRQPNDEQAQRRLDEIAS